MSIYLFGLATAVYYVIHSVLADHRVKAVLSKNLIPVKRYRLVYNLIAILLLFPLAGIYMSCEKQDLFISSMANQIPGIILFMSGSLMMRKALRQYDMAEFTGLDQLAEQDRAKQVLNTSGLNSIVRHPLYLASLLIFWGAFFIFPNDALLTLAVVSSFYIFIGIRLEEKKLLTIFGQQYRAYREVVPMIFPKFPWWKAS